VSFKSHLQAFHDMATHNVEDRTGGLDGSIVYELERPEVSCSASSPFSCDLNLVVST
jgi:hypothetical protein